MHMMLTTSWSIKNMKRLPVHRYPLMAHGHDVGRTEDELIHGLAPLDGRALGDTGASHEHPQAAGSAEQELLLRCTN